MAYEIISHGGRKLSRWIPDGATKVTEKNKLAVAYVYHKPDGKLVAIGYVGNSAKSAWHFRFKDEAAAAEKIKTFFEGVASWKTKIKERRVESSAPHTIPLGEVIYNSWGYDQTNIDWYKVIRTSANFVWLKPVASQSLPEEGLSPMSGRTVPRYDDNFQLVEGTGPETKHKVYMYDGSPRVHFKHGGGSVWDGKPQYESWYA